MPSYLELGLSEGR
jgi:hypothetical protein